MERRKYEQDEMNNFTPYETAVNAMKNSDIAFAVINSYNGKSAGHRGKTYQCSRFESLEGNY